MCINYGVMHNRLLSGGLMRAVVKYRIVECGIRIGFELELGSGLGLGSKALVVSGLGFYFTEVLRYSWYFRHSAIYRYRSRVF